jgi:hypothetical protein
VNLATGDIVYDDGEFTETAANGDTLHVTYTNGEGNLNAGRYTDDWTLDGGTGGFANVTGHGRDVFVVANPSATPPNRFVDTSTGVASADPSDRRQ